MRTASLVLLLTLGLSHGLFAKVAYVDDNASAGGDGTSWSSAHKYLQDALVEAEYGDSIWVAEGIYRPDQGKGKNIYGKDIFIGDQFASFKLVRGVNLIGGFNGIETNLPPMGDKNQTILSGEIDKNSSKWSRHVIWAGPDRTNYYRSGLSPLEQSRKDLEQVLDENTTLDGFLITNGNAGNGNGGGFYGTGSNNQNKHSKATIKDCIFIGNYASRGGGMYNTQGSSPHLISCIFENNSASEGGGIYNTEGGRGYSGSKAKLDKCIFKGNSASLRPEFGQPGWPASNYGGGMYNRNSAPILTDCVFESNYAHTGGGFYIESAYKTGESLKLVNCHVSKNTAYYGAGGAEYGEESFFINCIFEDNDAVSLGGGMFVVLGGNNGPTSFLNCVFSKNIAGEGAGIFNQGNSFSRGFAKIDNCIFTDNEARLGGGGMAISSVAQPRISNSLFISNIAKTLGGGLLWKSNSNTDWLKTGPSIVNSIFYENSAESSNADLESEYSNKLIYRVECSIVSREFGLNPILRTILGESFALNIFETPVFQNVNNGKGTDNIWFTKDDGFRLRENSPGIDAGMDHLVSSDLVDLDNDGNTTEPIPFDLAGFDRFISIKGLIGQAVDIGPYEYQNLSRNLELTFSFINKGKNWKESPWFGYCWNRTDTEWIYHSLLGWLYVHINEDGSVWLYSQDLSPIPFWLWTSPQAFPYLYLMPSGNTDLSQGSWVHLDIKSGLIQRWISQAWVTLGE